MPANHRWLPSRLSQTKPDSSHLGRSKQAHRPSTSLPEPLGGRPSWWAAVGLRSSENRRVRNWDRQAHSTSLSFPHTHLPVYGSQPLLPQTRPPKQVGGFSLFDPDEPRAARELAHVFPGGPSQSPAVRGYPRAPGPLSSLLILWTLRQTRGSSFSPLFLESEQIQVQILSAIDLLCDLEQNMSPLQALGLLPCKTGFVVRTL